jgi:hypothetical protein
MLYRNFRDREDEDKNIVEIDKKLNKNLGGKFNGNLI